MRNWWAQVREKERERACATLGKNIIISIDSSVEENNKGKRELSHASGRFWTTALLLWANAGHFSILEDIVNGHPCRSPCCLTAKVRRTSSCIPRCLAPPTPITSVDALKVPASKICSKMQKKTPRRVSGPVFAMPRWKCGWMPFNVEECLVRGVGGAPHVQLSWRQRESVVDEMGTEWPNLSKHNNCTYF